MRDPTGTKTHGTSKHSSKGSSSKRSSRRDKLAKSLLDSQTLSGTTTFDPPSRNLDSVTADSIRQTDAMARKQKEWESLVLANLASDEPEETSVQRKNEKLFHFSASASVATSTVPSKVDTYTTGTGSTDYRQEKETRHPSPVQDRVGGQSSKTRNSHRSRRGGGGVSSGASTSDFGDTIITDPRLEQRNKQGSKASLSTHSGHSDDSAIFSDKSRPPASIAATKKTTNSTVSSSSAQSDLKVSSERLEVLVMQLRDTENEKEAATIVLEFALRIKNHELVVQGADLSIINAMKRFSNSSKIQTRGCKALAEMASKGSPNIMSIIDKGGSEIILTAMAKHRAEEDLQKEACRAIECMARDSDFAKQSFGLNGTNAITSILHAMRDHPSAAKLQRMACRALAAVAADHSQCSQCVVNCGGLEVIRKTLKNHDNNTDVIENAFDILINIATAVKRSELDEQIAMTVSMDRILANMLLYRTNVLMQSQGMALLCMLCKESLRNRAKIASLYSLEVITKTLETCIVNKEVQRHGTTLLQYLSQSEGNTVTAALVSDGGMELLLNIIRRHGSDPIIVKEVNTIIAKLARPFSDTVRKEGGIELILSGMRRHEKSRDVQYSACMALSRLSAKTENANVINGNGGVSLINGVLSNFPADEGLSEVACEALASLSHDKQMMMAQQTLKARAANKKPESSWGTWTCGVSCF